MKEETTLKPSARNPTKKMKTISSLLTLRYGPRYITYRTVGDSYMYLCLYQLFNES